MTEVDVLRARPLTDMTEVGVLRARPLGGITCSYQRLIILFIVLFIPDCIVAEYRHFPECDDIAIVGAGIAGTYAAWKLRNTNQKITIYEYSNRVGGRLYTTQFEGVPDFNVELGAMRFKPASHVRLLKAINELGLKIRKFDLGSGPDDNTLMYLRGYHMRYKDVGVIDTPYTLRPEERIPYDQLRWELYANNTDILMNPEASVFQVKTLDGLPLYKQSMQSIISKLVNTDTAEYIKVVQAFQSLHGGINAAVSLPWPNPAAHVTEEVQTVEEGMGEIPRRFLKQFVQSSSRHTIITNRQLTRITRRKYDGTYVLHFVYTVTSNGKTTSANMVQRKCAKRVILATNRLSLEHLDWWVLKLPYFKDIIRNAVRDVPAGKIYFAYSDPWWRHTGIDFKYAISDTPLRQTYDFGTTNYSNISILNVGYMESDIVSLWDDLRKQVSTPGVSAISINHHIVRVVNNILAGMLNMSVNNIPGPYRGVVQIWNSYPFGGAWQQWMPGYNWSSIENEMVKPSPHNEVYVASNAFNGRTRSEWSEGALETVDLVLEHFNINSVPRRVGSLTL